MLGGNEDRMLNADGGVSLCSAFPFLRYVMTRVGTRPFLVMTKNSTMRYENGNRAHDKRTRCAAPTFTGYQGVSKGAFQDQ
jgi:hypothetical protein